MQSGDVLYDHLRRSIARQRMLFRSTLILNPVENIPFEDDIVVTSGFLHGLYNSDKPRERRDRMATPIQFAGRRRIERDSRWVYDSWAKALRAADVTLRLLSGLHAHIVLFMALARPGDTVLLLPVGAGGHVSEKSILERLGLNVVEMAVDNEAMGVDIARTLLLHEKHKPHLLFVDRSEGLVVEEFSPLLANSNCISIFDASQYLTNVLCGDHPNPLEIGFDYLVSSVHKNFPGPQKALLATNSRTEDWQRILRGISTFVSNMHTGNTYAASLTLCRQEWLAEYSKRMLRCAVLLEDELSARGVPAVLRPRDLPPTHHVWIRERSREHAFETYESLERCRILTNYRLLPYKLGHGIRLGLSAAVRLGLTDSDIPQLAQLISEIRKRGATSSLRHEARRYNEEIWRRA